MGEVAGLGKPDERLVIMNIGRGNHGMHKIESFPLQRYTAVKNRVGGVEGPGKPGERLVILNIGRGNHGIRKIESFPAQRYTAVRCGRPPRLSELLSSCYC